LGSEALAVLVGCAAILIAGVAICVRALMAARRAEQARAALAMRQRIFAEAERIGSMGSWHWDVRTNKILWSDQVYRMFGFEPTFQPTYDAYFARIHEEDRDRLAMAIQSAMFQGVPYKLQHRIVRMDGVVRTLSAQGEVAFNTLGQPVSMVGTCQDITDYVELQQEAEEGRRKQRELLDSLFSFVGLFSLDGTLVDANRAAIEAFGLERKDMIGRKIWDTYYWSYSPEIQAAVRDAIERAGRGEVVRGDYVVRVGEGAYITVDVTHSPLRNRDGKIVQVIGSAVDITERVRAEQASQYARAQLEQAQRIADIGSWEWDLATGALSWSEHCFHLVGWDPAGVAPTLERFMACVHPEDRSLLRETMRSGIEDGATCDYEHRVIWPNGEVRVLHQLGEVQRDANGRPFKMFGTTQDVTELHAARAELMESKLRAESANQAKSRFVASMSHELRTPLNAIIGFSELLQNDDGMLNEERRREYARDIHSSGKHLLSVINDILDISRIEAGKVTLDEDVTPIADLVESAFRMVRPRAEETGVTIEYQVEAGLTEVFADRRLLLQTLLNLASNAVKFTERGGRVEIMARGADDGGVEIAVRDTGIGMSAADVARVGEPFLQVDGRLSRKFEGTGLGLVIAKRLLEMHGGTLEIESALGKGTTMTICLPESRRAGGQRAEAPQSATKAIA
jgi:PAS domain S-box-containing protein